MKHLGDSNDTRYTVQAVLRACGILRAFHDEHEVLALRELVERTGLHKATAFRLLHNLELGGLVERVGPRKYRLTTAPPRRRRFRIGYAAQMDDSFNDAVLDGITRAAADHQVDLLVVHNRFSPKTTQRNVELMIKEKVDLAIEFQTYESIAPLISSAFLQASIPLIAIEIPHPGAVFYGANNYAAGLLGGHSLAKWAKQHWQGKVDEVLLLEVPLAGSVPQLRMGGLAAGIREILPQLSAERLIHLDGRGSFGSSFAAVRQHLRKTRAGRFLVGAINDPSALGALRAFEEVGRPEDCAVMGQNGIREARAELRRPKTRMIGTVAYFPERYGEGVIPLALSLLTKKYAAPAVYTKHRLLTPETVDRFYPNDSTMLADAPGVT